MKPLLVRLTLTAAIILIASGVTTAQEKSEIEKLQGQWVAESGQIKGKALSNTELAGISISFDEKHVKRKPNGLLIFREPKDLNPRRIDTSKWSYDFNVDSKKRPKELNVVIGWSGVQISTPWSAVSQGQPILERSIYAVEDQKLTICWGGDRRPIAFEAKSEDGFVLIVYKRRLGSHSAAQHEKVQPGGSETKKGRDEKGEKSNYWGVPHTG